MIVIISHYQNLLVNMDDEIEKVKGQHSDISSTNRYRYLLDTLEGFNKKHARKVNFIKVKKLKKLTKQRHTPDKNHPKSTDSNSWIPELSLTNTEKNFILNGEYICDRIIDSSMTLIHQRKPCFIFQSTSFNHNLLQYCPYQVIHIHHDGNSHFITTTNSPDGSIKLYDSLHLPPSSDLLKQIRSIYSPDPNITPTILQAEIKQQGNTDYGLFAIAYATELAFGHDPANFIFDQSQMRDHLFKCLTSKTIERFPKKQREINEKPVFNEITANQNISNKWNIPNKISNQQQLNHHLISSVKTFTSLSSTVKPNTTMIKPITNKGIFLIKSRIQPYWIVLITLNSIH